MLHHIKHERRVPSAIQRRLTVVVEAHADVEFLHQLLDQIELIGNEPHAE